ncbi:MAG: hypothetical protein WC812_00795 [Candidatus Pacearchaeota archaeon]|jgi:hypothetical protein
MLKTKIVPAIDEKTRKYLNSYLDQNFKVMHSDNPEVIVSEILNDKDLNLFLFSYLPKDNGVYLGRTEYFDQPVRVYVHYGLTVNFEDDFIRRAKLFLKQSFEESPAFMKENPKDFFFRKPLLTSSFPEEERYLRAVAYENFQGWPTLDKFLEEVNLAFSSNDEFRKRVYPLKFT